MTFALETQDITINFGGHVAVDKVSCAFASGTLTAIVGPNGAGKTTYFNLISGQLKATAGHVFLHGEDISKCSAPTRSRRGIGRAFQLTNLFPNLTVLENIRLAVQSRAGVGLNLWSIWSNHHELIGRAEEVLETVALTAKRDQPAAALPHGDQRKLEVTEVSDVRRASSFGSWASSGRSASSRTTSPRTFRGAFMCYATTWNVLLRN